MLNADNKRFRITILQFSWHLNEEKTLCEILRIDSPHNAIKSFGIFISFVVENGLRF